MKNLINYIIPFLVLILIFRFFNFIMYFTIRFWYVSIPLVLYLIYAVRRNRKKKKFKQETGLDPGDEIKLKEDPIIEDEKDTR